MKNNKSKILLSSLLSTAFLAIGCASCIPLASCVNITKKDTPENSEYHTVKFKDGGQTDVVIEGATSFKVRDGKPLATIIFPKATKGGFKFEGWCEDLTTHELVSLNTPVDDDMTLYPYFSKPIDLKNSVSLAVIETTKVWLEDDPYIDTLVEYSDDYGKNWKSLPESESTGLELSPGDNIFLRSLDSDSNGFSTPDDINRIRFSATGSVNIGGSIMGLLDNAEGTATEIPGAGSCFTQAFSDNPAIKYVSDTFLPATSLKQYCYSNLFYRCTNLKLAPSLPATTLATGCYDSMFEDCTSLNMINLPNYQGDVSASDGFNEWLNGVETDGQLIYNGTGSVTEIPTTWESVKPTTISKVVCYDEKNQAYSDDYQYVVDHPYQFRAYDENNDECKNITWTSTNTDVASVNPDTGVVTPIRANKTGETCEIVAHYKLAFQTVIKSKAIKVREIYQDTTKMGLVALKATAKNTSVTWDFVGEIGEGKNVPEFRWSLDGHSWRKMWAGSPVEITNDKTTTGTIYIKGNNFGGLNGEIVGGLGDKSHTSFTFTGQVEISGNIMGLVDDGRSEQHEIPSTYCFNNLFAGATSITKVSSDFLSKATKLTKGCYSSMFSRCTNLTSAPALSVTDLSDCDSCYERMFYGCTKLTTAPSLQSQKLSDYCYSLMFYGAGLTSSPALPATAAAVGCYYMMFQHCYSLLDYGNIGVISLTSLQDYSCYQMFAGDEDITGYVQSGRTFYDQTARDEKQRSWWSGSKLVFTCPALEDESGNPYREPVTRMFTYLYYDPDGEEYNWIYTSTGITKGMNYYH